MTWAGSYFGFKVPFTIEYLSGCQLTACGGPAPTPLLALPRYDCYNFSGTAQSQVALPIYCVSWQPPSFQRLINHCTASVAVCWVTVIYFLTNVKYSVRMMIANFKLRNKAKVIRPSQMTLHKMLLIAWKRDVLLSFKINLEKVNKLTRNKIKL